MECNFMMLEASSLDEKLITLLSCNIQEMCRMAPVRLLHNSKVKQMY
jgi:hypothetical protein